MKQERQWVIEYPLGKRDADSCPVSKYKLEEWIIISEWRWRRKTKPLTEHINRLCRKVGKRLGADVGMVPTTLTQCVISLGLGRAANASADYRFRNVVTGEIIPATTLGL